MSSNTIRKAKKLVENNGVAKIDDDLYQVKSSSDPNMSRFQKFLQVSSRQGSKGQLFSS